MNEFFQRLKQRKLVQWAVAYIAAAFALLQGIDIVAQQFGWPEGVRRGITLGLVVGFFVTLVLAWYHGERGAQRVTGTELLILALLLTIGGGFLWRFAGVAHERIVRPALTASSPAPAAIPEKSIAVLPLANESGEKGEQYFSDGLSEDLITALSQFAGLKVINRNSSFQFRDSKDDSRTIGAKLDVAHLLEGSVRRAGDAVRVSAELVNVADGTTRWSEHYDRPYKDLFKLQDDITTAVAAALKAKLLNTIDLAAQGDHPPSGNLEAYNAYLQGHFYSQRNTDDDYRRAIDFYQTAVSLDPRYAHAYASLAYAQIFLGDSFRGPQAQQIFATARRSVDTALTLNPDLAMAHGARALLLAWADLDFAGAKAELERAVQLAPSDLDLRASLGQMRAAFGHPEGAIELIKQSLATDPRNAGWYGLLAGDLMAVGRLDEAEQTARDQIALEPAANGPKARLSAIEVLRGNAAAALEKAEQVAPGQSRDFALANARQIGNDPAAAEAALKALIKQYADTDAYLIARAYALRKDPRFAAFCRKVGLPTPGEIASDST